MFRGILLLMQKIILWLEFLMIMFVKFFFIIIFISITVVLLAQLNSDFGSLFYILIYSPTNFYVLVFFLLFIFKIILFIAAYFSIKNILIFIKTKGRENISRIIISIIYLILLIIFILYINKII